MKKIVFFFVVFLSLSNIKLFAQDPPQMKDGFVMTKDYVDPFVAEDKLYFEQSSKGATFHTFDVLDYKLELNLYKCYISPYPHSYVGIETITFKVDSVLDKIKLNARNSYMIVNKVSAPGISFNHANDTLTINLDRIYNIGEVLSIVINYSHLPIDDLSFHAKNGFVFTDCSPEKARNWFPCWDKQFDKATFETVIKTPPGTELVSNGSLIDSAIVNDTLVYHWKSKDPMSTYIMAALSNTNFKIKKIYWKRPSNLNDSIPITFYYNLNEKVDSLKKVMLHMMDFFSDLYGEYPFEKLAWASLNSDFPWAGMENQTVISLYTNGWNDKKTTSHEFAHHWFGDLITHATWSDIFVKEGFPTFSACLWAEELSGKTGYLAQANEFKTYYMTNNKKWPIYNESWTNTTPVASVLFDYSITYCKSACVLYMLRHIMGDAAFFKSLKDYATDPNLMFKTATIYDFYQKINANSPTDLTWFMDEWLKQPNHPIYANTYSTVAAKSSFTLNYTINQTQTDGTFFKMPFELKVIFDDNTESVVTGFNDINNQTFTFTFDKNPVALVFDPENKIFLKQETLPALCTTAVTLTSPSETIDDGSGDFYYNNNTACNWLINPNNNPSSITTYFLEFNTQATNDKLVVYEMAPIFKLIGTYSGSDLPTTLTVNATRLKYYFVTDASVTGKGWKLRYEANQASGINNMGNIMLLSLFPNPVVDKLNYKINFENTENAEVTITDILGKTIYFQNIGSYDGDYSQTIDLPKMSSGIYIFKVSTNNGNIIQKFIIN